MENAMRFRDRFLGWRDWLRRPVVHLCVLWLQWRKVPVMMNWRLSQSVRLNGVNGGFLTNLDISPESGSAPILLEPRR